MDKQQIEKLETLGIDCSQTTIDIFDNLLELAVHLNELLEMSEEERFAAELDRLKRNSN